MQVSETGKYDDLKITNRYRRLEDDPWKLDTAPVKPCWKRPSSSESSYEIYFICICLCIHIFFIFTNSFFLLAEGKEKQDNGYIFFSLTRGPEFHASQVYSTSLPFDLGSCYALFPIFIKQFVLRIMCSEFDYECIVYGVSLR